MKYSSALVPGDGIGPEVVDAATDALKIIADIYSHDFVFTEYPAGGCAIDKFGIPLPKETVDGCLASDSVLLGTLNKVVDGGGHVTAGDHINGGEHCHGNDTYTVVNVEGHTKQTT